MKIVLSYSPPNRANYSESDMLWMLSGQKPKPHQKQALRLVMLPLLLLLTGMLLTGSLRSQNNLPQTVTGENVSPPVLVSLPLEVARLVNDQQYELKALRIEVIKIYTNEAAEKARYERETKQWEARIEAERRLYEQTKERIALAEKETDIMKQRAQFYEDSYNVCMNKNKSTKWCWFKKHILFVWPWRCK